MTRRDLFGSGAWSVAATTQPAPGIDPRTVRDIERRLDEIKRELGQMNQGTFTGEGTPVEKLRDAMVLFLRANQKYPDFFDVGYGVFHAMLDWHVHNRQAVNVARSADGRYGLAFMFSRLILRPDAVPDFIGVPYDQRA